MNNNEWLPFGKNIKVKPVSKNKIIGDTSKYELFGDVIAVGDEVKKIEAGDQVSFSLWGIKNSITAEHYIIPEDSDFINEVKKKYVE